MKIAISKFERDLLLTHPETPMLAQEVLSEVENALNGSPEQCDTLRDACAGLLLRIGFDEDYVATIEGHPLEDLIDQLLVE